jgi:hypothetical protein
MDEADRQRPAEEPAVRGDRVAPERDLCERGAGVRQQRLARGRQAHRAAVAQEDALAELGLEPADLLADRRLGDPQPLRRAREVRLLGHGDEIGELTELHA